MLFLQTLKNNFDYVAQKSLQILGDKVVQRRTHGDRKSNVFVFEVWKGTHWRWHSSPEWDNGDVLTQHLPALLLLIQTHKASSTRCEWPTQPIHSSSLSPLPDPLVYSHDRPAVLLWGENVNTLTGAEATKQPCVALLCSRKLYVPWCACVFVWSCVCFFVIPSSRNDNMVLPGDGHVFGG